MYDPRKNRRSTENKDLKMKKTELILVPAPLIGHLVSIVGLAKILAEQYHEQQLFVTVLILKLPHDENFVSYSKQLVADSSSSGIRFVELITSQEPTSSESRVDFMFEFIDSYKNQVRDILSETSSEVGAVIVDMFCTSMIDVANEFGVPSYVFFASGAAVLGLTLHLQKLRDEFSEDVASYCDKDISLSIPTYINPVPAKLFPGIVFEKEQGGSNAFLDQAKKYRLSKGIIINTLLELESYAVQALTDDETIPRIYTAGPIVKQNQENDSEIMKWLNLQPNSSVVFLCFGSHGRFSKKQVMEIAYALQHTGYRFLWSLRLLPPAGTDPSSTSSLDEVLPEGFLKNTIDKDIGKVIGWAPQMEILSHPAVGCFVSHCGWNSTLESMCCGVPMAAFPIYAEQQANAFLMVKELGLAVEIKIDHRKEFWDRSNEEEEEEEDGIVKAEVIENGIKELMNQENGRLRNKVMEMKEKCRLALMEEGSSFTSLRCFIDDVISYKK